MTSINSQETWLLVGCSRGFGQAFAQWVSSQDKRPKFIFVSRKTQVLQSIAQSQDFVFSCDLSSSSSVEILISQLREIPFHRFIYFAGGGPFGFFQEKGWKDHLWSWNVSFLSCAELIHTFMASPSLKQIIAIGSAIAENSADPESSSYASAKHALRGLITSIQAENHSFDIRLYSPGYMDTNLLPPQAWPRFEKNLVMDPQEVARDLWQWMQDPSQARQNKIITKV